MPLDINEDVNDNIDVNDDVDFDIPDAFAGELRDTGSNFHKALEQNNIEVKEVPSGAGVQWRP